MSSSRFDSGSVVEEWREETPLPHLVVASWLWSWDDDFETKSTSSETIVSLQSKQLPAEDITKTMVEVIVEYGFDAFVSRIVWDASHEKAFGIDLANLAYIICKVGIRYIGPMANNRGRITKTFLQAIWRQFELGNFEDNLMVWNIVSSVF